MPVIGLNFTRMEAKKGDKPFTGEINVNSTPKITEVREVGLPSLDKKALSLGFEFVTEYGPDLAEIRIEGNLLFLAGDNAPVLKQWKKDKTIPEDVSVPVLNHLFRRCLIKIAGLADELQLPPPLQLPIVKPREHAEKKESA